MLYEREPGNEQAVKNSYRQLRRGWYVGDELFRDKLLNYLPEEGAGDNLRGEQRRDHGEAKAEDLILRATKAFGIDESELLSMKSARLEKQAVAWLIKSRTVMTGVWVAERLTMGHPINVSRAVTKFKIGKESVVKNAKQKMMKC